MPSTAALLPPSSMQLSDVADYKTLALSIARNTAAKCIQQAQKCYKKQYDRTATTTNYHIGKWVLVRFPAEESGRYRKLSRSWHGSYCATQILNPDIAVTNSFLKIALSLCTNKSETLPS